MSDGAKLSNTGYVILGFLHWAPQSGYEIKQRIDISTRNFFAASYGQIYPELKRLEELGLVVGEQKQQGHRARTEYSITEPGREALTAWIDQAHAKVEFRDEGLLRLFFVDADDIPRRIATLEAIREERVASLVVLHEIERAIGFEKQDPNRSLTLDFGLGLFEYAIEWCDRTIAELKTIKSAQARQKSPATIAPTE